MRKMIRILSGAAIFMAWGYLIVIIGMPEIIPDIQRTVESVFRDYSIPYETDGELYTLLDENVPLAGPNVVGEVERNGWLCVKDGTLLNEAGEAVQLRGMSSHGLAWYPQYTGRESIRTTKEYGANLFRVAMYVDDKPRNYTLDAQDKQNNKDAMYTALDNTLGLDMYAIADWHIREDGNPLNRLDCAVEFFDELSKRYANEPGIIYEISSDPNGDTTWDDLYTYADHVVPVIRRNAPNAVIIVGTLNYSTDLTATLDKPIPYDNIMYAYHYNSGVHKNTFRAMLDATKKAGLPVITTWALGGGDVPIEEAERYAMDFVAYVQANNISWASWSLANKDESFSAIRNDVDKLERWKPDDLTVSGKIAFAALAK